MKKTLKILSENYNMTLAKVCISVLNNDVNAENTVLSELIRLNIDGIVIFEYRGLNECHKRLGINYQTFRTALNRLVEKGCIKREGHAIYLHPMLSGIFDTWEMRKV